MIAFLLATVLLCSGSLHAAVLTGRRPFGRFLQLTDIHYDPLYYDGPDRTEFCHRPITGDSRQPIGKRRCDSSPLFINRTLEHLAEQLTGDHSADFLVWTGDTARHDVDPTAPRTLNDVWEANDLLTRRLSQLIDPRLIVPVIGNNDVAPVTVDNDSLPAVLNVLASAWKPMLSSQSSEQLFRRNGYFMKRISTTLSVVSMNTLLFHKPNWDLNDCQEPESRASQHLTWLAGELGQLAAMMGASKQRVIIAGHIAPARSLYSESCREQYLQLALQYRDMIVGHLFGHTNYDYLNLLSDHAKVPAAVMFTCSSVLPVMNPSYRLYEYDTNTNMLQDYQHYVALIDQTDQRRPLNYRLSYSYREVYGTPDLSPQSISRVRQRFHKDVYLWKEHLRRMVVFHPYWLEQIDMRPFAQANLSFQSTAYDDDDVNYNNDTTQSSAGVENRHQRNQDEKFWMRLRDLYCDMETASVGKYECLRLFN
jgi:hypothetical protein